MKYCDRPGLSDYELDLWQKEKKGESVRCRVSQESIDIMDEYLLEGINSKVGVNDTLIHNGDFSKSQASYFRSKIKCKNVILIFGNHDSRREMNGLFSGTYDLYTVKFGGYEIVNCHYALATWNKMHHGALHCYGHSHSGAEENLEKLFPNRRAMDVGVDNAKKLLGKYEPFSFEEVIDIMSKREVKFVDNHNSKTNIR